MIYVLDANAMIAWLNGEAGAQTIEQLLLPANVSVAAHAINVCEVFYDAYRVGGEANAQQVLDVLRIKAQMHIYPDLDPALWQVAGRLKADWRKISLADCFGLALAQRIGGQFLTADHHELDPLAAAGFPITFFR